MLYKESLDCGLVYADGISNHSKRHIVLSHAENKRLGVLRELRANIVSSAFVEFILIIVGLRAKKEMGGLNARRVVASMKNVLPLWYFAVMHKVSRSMCSGFVVSGHTRGIADNAVSRSVSLTRPVPAANFSSINLSQESKHESFIQFHNLINPLGVFGALIVPHSRIGGYRYW